MKAVLVLVSLMSTVTADDCSIHGSYGDMSASCLIPSVTTISKSCCTQLQDKLDGFFSGRQPWGTRPSQEMIQDCASFEQYVQNKRDQMMREDKRGLIEMLKATPDGFDCKEVVVGGGDTACSLHAQAGDFSVKCDIPESTTISSDCCDTIQHTIDQPPSPQEGQALQKDVMTKCKSVIQWGMQRMQSLGPPPPEGEEMLKWWSQALPAGLSCTEKTTSGMSHSIVKAILTNFVHEDAGALESQSAASSSLSIPMVAVAGLAGAVGGLIVFFMISKASSKSHRVPLISEDA